MIGLESKPVIVIVGPTGIGKTALAVSLARAVKGEIISADSRQVYQGMDIGTAKASAFERSQAKHHLVDILRPDASLTVTEFQSRANAVIRWLHEQHAMPLVVGGTGLYVRVLIEGWQIPEVPPALDIRAEWEMFARDHGPVALHNRLADVDPDSAARIDTRNVRRVIRALEVFEITGKPFSHQRRRSPPPYSFLQIGLTRPRESLYQIIDRRIDAMIDNGLIEEVKHLVASGYNWSLPSMSSLGYREIGAFLRGEIALADAVAQLRRATRAFIRKQYNWFSLTDSSIHWFDLEIIEPEEIVRQVKQWLKSSDDSTVGSG